MLNYIITFLGLQFQRRSRHLEFAFYVAISLVVLLCFINVFCYFMGYYIKDLPIIVKKYPVLKLINLAYKSPRILLILEALIGFTGLIGLIYCGFSPLFREYSNSLFIGYYAQTLVFIFSLAGGVGGGGGVVWWQGGGFVEISVY